jgi:hypothetical protein
MTSHSICLLHLAKYWLGSLGMLQKILVRGYLCGRKYLGVHRVTRTETHSGGTIRSSLIKGLCLKFDSHAALQIQLHRCNCYGQMPLTTFLGHDIVANHYLCM